jgi:hypothetical protein
VLGNVAAQELLPKLPISALAIVCPTLAGIILEYRRAGWTAVFALLSRALDYRRISAPIWFASIFLLMPAIMIASYLVMWAMGWPLPPFELQITRAVILFALFFVSGIAEELGWSGYATDPLQERHGALNAALVIGVVWAVWHVVPLLQAGRVATWIGAWGIGTVGLRVLTVWIYNNTSKSVFAAAVFHAVCNVSWQLFPIAGSAYDARVTGPLEALAAVTVVIVWGAETLARPQNPLKLAAR